MGGSGDEMGLSLKTPPEFQLRINFSNLEQMEHTVLSLFKKKNDFDIQV